MVPVDYYIVLSAIRPAACFIGKIDQGLFLFICEGHSINLFISS